MRTEAELNKALEALFNEIEPYVDFEFIIERYPDLGFAVLDIEQDLPINMGTVMDFVEKKQMLTSDYVKRYKEENNCIECGKPVGHPTLDTCADCYVYEPVVC